MLDVYMTTLLKYFNIHYKKSNFTINKCFLGRVEISRMISGVSIGGATGAQTLSGAHEGRKTTKTKRKKKQQSRIATGPCFCE